MTISTHILDASRGMPAEGVTVSLARETDDGGWLKLNEGVTDKDGRCRDLLSESTSATPGVYRIRFETAAYYARLAVAGLYPYVEVAFRVDSGQNHLHIPLLLTANSFTTYRGS